MRIDYSRRGRIRCTIVSSRHASDETKQQDGGREPGADHYVALRKCGAILQNTRARRKGLPDRSNLKEDFKWSENGAKEWAVSDLLQCDVSDLLHRPAVPCVVRFRVKEQCGLVSLQQY